MIVRPPGAASLAIGTVTGPDATITVRGSAARFEIGSVTKTFTVLLLRCLAADRVVDLDDPVNLYLPAGRRLGSDGVTLRHLAMHKAGLPKVPLNLFPTALRRWRTNPYAGYTTAHLLRATARARCRPDAPYRYSNLGVALLGEVLARAAGDAYERVVVDRVCRPLGLTATGAGVAPGTDATGHDRHGRRMPPLEIGGMPGAGALRSTAEDLARYLRAWLHPEQTPLAAVFRTAPPIGWNHIGDIWSHSGCTRGFTAFIGFRPATGTAVAAVADAAPHRSAGVIQQAFDMLASPS